MQNQTHIVDPVMLEEQAQRLSSAVSRAKTSASVTERAYSRDLVRQSGRDLTMIRYALYTVTRRTRDLYHDVSLLDNALVEIADAARRLQYIAGGKAHVAYRLVDRPDDCGTGVVGVEGAGAGRFIFLLGQQAL